MEYSAIWNENKELPKALELELPGRIENIILHRCQEDYKFLHESAIVFHNNSFFAAWNNSPNRESEKGTVVRWIRSDDKFETWTEPKSIAPPIQSETRIWESIQFLSLDGELWAFIGQVHTQPRSPEQSKGNTVIFKYDSSSDSWLNSGTIPEFHPLNPPQKTPEGNWIMGGQYNLIIPKVAVSKGSDMTEWQTVEIPTKEEDNIYFAETSLLVTEKYIRSFIRSNIESCFSSISTDGGCSWQTAKKSNLPMSPSKTAAGTLSTGQSFLAFNFLDNSGQFPGRNILALAVSKPGSDVFEKIIPIRTGISLLSNPTETNLNSQWSYPSVQEVDGKVYVAYSASKNACVLSILPLSEFMI